MQALSGAETAYAHAMTATSSIPLPGECDGDIMKAALNAFSSLPQVCHNSNSSNIDTSQLMMSELCAQLACMPLLITIFDTFQVGSA